MRFMLMVIGEGFESEAMKEYNTALQKAGVLLALDRLFPSSTGARIAYADGKATIIEEPFVETISAYWTIQVRSREEAIEWARRAPMSNKEVIEVRQMSDFLEHVQGFDQRNVVH